jgi:hypothetical protein
MKPLLLIFLVLFGIQLSNAFFSTYNFHQPINPLRRLRPISREQRAQVFFTSLFSIYETMSRNLQPGVAIVAKFRFNF